MRSVIIIHNYRLKVIKSKQRADVNPYFRCKTSRDTWPNIMIWNVVCNWLLVTTAPPCPVLLGYPKGPGHAQMSELTDFLLHSKALCGALKHSEASTALLAGKQYFLLASASSSAAASSSLAWLSSGGGGMEPARDHGQVLYNKIKYLLIAAYVFLQQFNK